MPPGHLHMLRRPRRSGADCRRSLERIHAGDYLTTNRPIPSLAQDVEALLKKENLEHPFDMCSGP